MNMTDYEITMSNGEKIRFEATSFLDSVRENNFYIIRMANKKRLYINVNQIATIKEI